MPDGPRRVLGRIDKELVFRGRIVRSHPAFGKRSHLVLHTASVGDRNSVLAARPRATGGRTGRRIGVRRGQLVA